MKCATKFCRGHSTASGHSKYCGKCRSRRWAKNRPAEYAFKNLRVRAKQRGKKFTLTIVQWREFWNANNLGELRGKTKNNLTVNRKDNRIGYTADNIEAITLSQNSRLKYAPLPDYVRAEMERESL